MTGREAAGDMSADGDIQNNSSANDEQDAGTPAPAEESTGEGTDQEPEDQEPKDQEPRERSRRAATPAGSPGGVLPNKAAEDDPRRWGDQRDNYDHDAWLQEQKPPHWG
jgi:hypothetical protein